MKELFDQYIAHTSEEPIGMEIERGEGIFLYAPDGRKWIDFISGICVTNVGHSAPEVVSAIQKQAALYLHPMVYGEAVMSPQAHYGAKIINLLDNRLRRVYFTNSGAEATEGALKIAKKFTGRGEFVSCYNAYHGSTHGALSVGGNPRKKEGYGPLLPGVSHIRFNHPEDLTAITEKTAAVIIEAIQGTAGIILPRDGYLQKVRQRCDETGALMILDEIQTAFGRTGYMFAHQYFGIEPDILLLAKSLGGGLPLGAFVAREEVMAVIQKNPMFGHITTFGGNPVSCAAGMAAVTKIIEEDLMGKMPAKEAILRARLKHPAIRELRGMGLLFGLIFENLEFAEAVRKSAYDKGLLTLGFINIDNGLRISPPLTISEAEIHQACDIILASVEEVWR
ncbi:MAG: aspartate aminotransferase family protein [Bacteroidia bacterium]|nr:aspartate aminotransferase family protein [Bacteroidia bacterium]